MPRAVAVRMGSGMAALYRDVPLAVYRLVEVAARADHGEYLAARRFEGDHALVLGPEVRLHPRRVLRDDCLGLLLQIPVERRDDLQPSLRDDVRAVLLLEGFADEKDEVRRFDARRRRAPELDRFFRRPRVLLFRYQTLVEHAPEHELLPRVEE